MTEELHKAIMKRSRIRKKFLKDRTTKKSYYSNLDIKKL